MKTSVFILNRSMISSPSHAECYALCGGHFAPRLAAARPYLWFSIISIGFHLHTSGLSLGLFPDAISLWKNQIRLLGAEL